MSYYGLKVKNPRGEIVTDGISSIGQHIATGNATINGYQYADFDSTAFANTLNLDVAWSISNWASPLWRLYTRGQGRVYNRFWFTLTPAPVFKISLLRVGTGIEDNTQDYGFKVAGGTQYELLNAKSRTLRWCSDSVINASWDTKSGVYHSWLWGPVTLNYTSVGLKTAPFVMVSPLIYAYVSSGAEYCQEAIIFKCSTTIMQIGAYLHQTVGYTHLAGNKSFRVVLFTLD